MAQRSAQPHQARSLGQLLIQKANRASGRLDSDKAVTTAHPSAAAPRPPRGTHGASPRGALPRLAPALRCPACDSFTVRLPEPAEARVPRPPSHQPSGWPRRRAAGTGTSGRETPGVGGAPHAQEETGTRSRVSRGRLLAVRDTSHKPLRRARAPREETVRGSRRYPRWPASTPRGGGLWLRRVWSLSGAP